MGSYKLRAFVRYTSANKVIPGSLILRKKMPKNTYGGKWVELIEDLCCTTTSTTTTTTTVAPG